MKSTGTSVDAHIEPREDNRPLIDVSVIIVSFNTCDVTCRCLECLRGDLQGLEAEVIVVDNASTDGSVEAIRKAFPDVRVIASERNLGFGAANNLAMRQARGRYFLLLNSDAFVRPGTIRTLMEELEDGPEVGVVGPKLLNEDGSTQRSCFRYPTPGRAWLETLRVARWFKPRSPLGDYRRWAHDEACEVDWAVGACLLLRREVFEQVGGFDERFFLYAEETDWQKRIREAGWSIRFTPRAELTHLGGASGASDRVRINEHFFAGLDRYQRKHHGVIGLIAFRLAMVVGSVLRLPGWGAVYLLQRTRRVQAGGKVRLHGWLICRQMFHWSRQAELRKE